MDQASQPAEQMDSYASSIPARYIENCIKYNGRILPTVTRIFGEASRAEIPPTNLDFSNEYMSDKSAIAIMHTIVEKIPYLKSLSFKGCGIGEEAIVAMSEIFGEGGGGGGGNSKENGVSSPSSSSHSCSSSSCLLQEINVLGNDLYASSGRALIALLRSNPRLYKIEVNTNEMPDRVATALRKAEKRNYDACFPPPPPLPVPDKYRSRERLDALIAEIGPLLASSSHSSMPFSSSLPSTNHSTLALHAAKVRLMNYWNLRLGSFGVQFLLDNGFSVETVRKMMLIERRVRCVESVTDVRAVAAFRSPLDTLEKELNLIGAQLADEKSLLSRLSAIRDGGTIRMQFETCKELLALLSSKKGEGYSSENRGREGAPDSGGREASSSFATTAATNFEKGEATVDLSATIITKLMVTMHHLRMSIAGVTLRDFYDETSRLAKLNATVTGGGASSTGDDESSYSHNSKQTRWGGDVKEDTKRRALIEVCEDFEQYMHSLASFLSLVVYESSRRLSLLCDEFKYFTTNHKAFAQTVAARGCTMSRMIFPSLLSSTSLPTSSSGGNPASGAKEAAHAAHNEEEDAGDEEGNLTQSAALAFGTLISESVAEEARTHMHNSNNNNSASSHCPPQQQRGGGQLVDDKDLSFLFSAADAPSSPSSSLTIMAMNEPSYVELQRRRNELIERLESLLSIPFCTAGPAMMTFDPAISVSTHERTMGSMSQKGDLSIIASLQSVKLSETTNSASTSASVRAGRVVVPEAPRVPATLMSLRRGDDGSSDSVLLSRSSGLLDTVHSIDKNDTLSSSCSLPTMVDFLRYYAVCRAHQGGIGDRWPSYWSSVAAYVHPFYRTEGPTLSSDPYAEFALPAVPDRPRPSRASEVYADVSATVLGRRGLVSEGSSPTTVGMLGSAANSVGKPKAGFVAGDGHGLDITDIFASIGSKAELLTWFRQYSAFVRYLLVLGNGESIPSL